MDIGRSGGNGAGNTNLPGGSDPHVQQVVKAAHEELRQLMRQRADVMKRIGTVKQTIVGLANLFGDEVLSEELLELVDRRSGGRQPGFTKACRMVLMEAARLRGGTRRPGWFPPLSVHPGHDRGGSATSAQRPLRRRRAHRRR